VQQLTAKLDIQLTQLTSTFISLPFLNSKTNYYRTLNLI